MTGLSERSLRNFPHARWVSLRSTHPTSTFRESQSECRPIARALEGGGGAVDRLLAVVAAHQHEPDGSAVLHPAWYADRRMPVTLNGHVLRVGSQLRCVISCGVASLPGIGVAFIGTVGSSRRSCAARTAS